METKMLEAFRAIGIPKEEACVYLSLVKHPRLTISDISRKTGIKRPTCYQHLDNLLAKDFVIRVPSGKRMLYCAVTPRKLLEIAKKRYKSFEDSCVSLLEEYEESINKPKIVFYEGKRELKSIYEDVFKTIGDVYSIFPPSAFFQNFSEEEYAEFDMIINKNALRSKDLIVNDNFFKKVDSIRKMNNAPEKLTKKLPRTFESNVDLIIYNNKVALISLRDLSALVIENKDIAKLFINLHDFIWKNV